MFSNQSIRRVSGMLLTSFIAGCATPPNQISASYVSPLQYAAFTCEQIKPELLRVNSEIVKVTGVQDQVATKDAVAMGVGLILFWPALFFLASGDDKKAELAHLKGEYEALEHAAIQKNCAVADELRAAKAQREAFEKKQRAEQQKAAIAY